MKSYLRFLSRNKLYTAIEVVGLSIALAFVIPLVGYYANIVKVSQGHENYENIYSISSGGMQTSSPGFGSYLLEKVPEIEIVSSPILDNRRSHICESDRRIHYVDKEFFYFFPCRFIEGDDGFLDIPNAVAVSKEFADVLAPEGSAIGKTIDYEWTKVVVAAVFDDYGNGVIEECDILERNNGIVNSDIDDLPYRHRGSVTLFSVNENADISEIREKVITAAKEYWGAKDPKYSDYPYDIIRYDKITTDKSSYIGMKTNSLEATIILCVLCLLLFTISLLNYINLNIAQISGRAKEMAIRKFNGADQKSVILEYCIESLLFTTFCFLSGLALSKLTSSMFSRFVINTGMGEGVFTLSWTPFTILIFIGIIIITGLICGIVPALIASGFTALDITKGNYRYHSKKTLSRIFIGFQSLLSVILLATTLLMETQYRKMKAVTYNCDIEDVFWYAPKNWQFKTEEMKELLKTRPEILKAGITDGIPGFANASMAAGIDNVDQLYSTIKCDEDAFDVFGFEVLSQNNSDSRLGIWLTPTAEKTFNEHPGLLEMILKKDGIDETRICGMVQDFPGMSDADIDQYPAIVAVLPTELIRNKELAIKTTSDHKAARKIIADAYSKVSGKEVDDIMSFGYTSLYIKELHIEQIASYKEMLNLIRTILILVILMTMMGLTGMSTYYASERRHEIAVRKVFGGTAESETARNLLRYLRITLIADLAALPLVHLIFTTFRKMPIGEKVESTIWIYVLAVLISFAISLASVLWQTLRAARTNPAEALKKE